MHLGLTSFQFKGNPIKPNQNAINSWLYSLKCEFSLSTVSKIIFRGHISPGTKTKGGV